MRDGLEAEVQRLLGAVKSGQEGALNALVPYVYEELRRLARKVRQGAPQATLNTTALVHEAYLKLLPGHQAGWQDRLHFMRVAARAMRQVLVDHARARKAQKRGSGEAWVTLSDEIAPPMRDDELLSFDEALGRLEKLSERQARVVEYRFFVGLTIEEVAEALAVSPVTVRRDWRLARAWLARELSTAA